MRLSSWCRMLVLLLATLLIATHGNVIAQSITGQPSSATQAAIAATKPQTDFSYSIDPLSIKSFSDEQLISTFEKMSAGYSKNAILFNNIGATFYKRKMYDMAEAAFKRAIVLNNDPAFLTNLSIIYDTQNRLTDAIDLAQRALD